MTDPVRTVLDCAATMPLPEALAVADSALRIGRAQHAELVAPGGRRRGPGCGAARDVARLADERSANAFESALRGHLLLAGIDSFVPQHVIAADGVFAQVDLADPERKVALEADGYAVHGDRRRFARDLRRHDELATLGWLTLRFAWSHVMYEPGWVVDQVRRARDGRRRRPPGVRRGAYGGRRPAERRRRMPGDRTRPNRHRAQPSPTRPYSSTVANVPTCRKPTSSYTRSARVL